MPGLLHPDSPDALPAAPTSIEWPGSLIGLLGRLEAFRPAFDGKRLVPDAEALIGHAEAMVQAADDLARRTKFPDGLADIQARALSKAGAFFTAANALKKAPAKNLVASVLNSLSGTDGPTADAVRDCLLAAVDVLNGYFMLFTERYKSSASARGWVDAASAFQADFKQLVRDLPAK